MNIFNLEDFPCAEFGEAPARKVRLLVSPQTTGENRCSIVASSVPPGGISEGHVHAGSDEYIYFDIGGEFVIDGRKYKVKEKSVVLAPKGSTHECINTSKDEELTLLCFFLPPFEIYGKYPELIEKTKDYIEKENKLNK